MNNKLLLILLFLLSSCTLIAQDQDPGLRLPEGLSIGNELKYSFDIESKTEIFENWLNLDYQYSAFSAGIRYEIFQPNDPNPAVYRSKKRYGDIGFRYVSAMLGDINAGGEITAGNFYMLMGRGMLVKIYEDRNLRVDNNLAGVHFEGWYRDIYMKAFSGSAENTLGQRNEILHAADIEYRGLPFLHAGITYASNQPESPALARTGVASVRLQPQFENFDIYTEFAVKHNDDFQSSAALRDEKISGKALYTGLSVYNSLFSMTAEYKLYDNMVFGSSDGTVIYNTPPGVRRDYSFALMNRHPVPLDQNNEEGYQIDFLIPYAQIYSLNFGYSRTVSLSNSSYYKRLLGSSVPSQESFEEFFISTKFNASPAIELLPALGYMEESVTNTIAVTPILQYTHRLTDFTSVKASLEHQYVKNRVNNERYYIDQLTLEFHRSPDIRISFVSEMESKEPTAGNVIRKFWNFAQFAYRVNENLRFSILAGSRQAGNICIGGVCRYEPEFRGVELRMFTTL